MKLIIAGTRDFADRFAPWIPRDGREVVARALEVDALPSPGEIETVVSGEAVGPDEWGVRYAMSHGIDVDRHPPEWDRYEDTDELAPYVRNREMAQAGDELLAFWDGKSGGTRHMIDQAMKQGVTKHVVRMDAKRSREALLNDGDARPKINTYDPNPSQDLSKVAKTVGDD